MSQVNQEKPYLKILVRIYKIIMILLSLTIMALSIWELVFKLDEDFIHIVNKFDFIIMSIFIIDLLVNLKLAKDKKHFIKISVIELLLIIPLAVFLRLPGQLREKTGINIPTGDKTSYIKNHPKLRRYVNIVLSQKFILRSIAFFMKPSVIRATKFFNLSRNYLNKTKSKKD